MSSVCAYYLVFHNFFLKVLSFSTMASREGLAHGLGVGGRAAVAFKCMGSL